MLDNDFTNLKVGDEVYVPLFRCNAKVYKFFQWFKNKKSTTITNTPLLIIQDRVECGIICLHRSNDRHKITSVFFESLSYPYDAQFSEENGSKNHIYIPLTFSEIEPKKTVNLHNGNEYLIRINKYRDRMAQRHLDPRDWTAEDLHVECKRLGLL